MIVTTAPHAAAATAVKSAGVGVRVPATGLFARSLAGFLDTDTADPAPVAGKDERQEPADRGSDLPAEGDGPDADPLAWLVAVPMPVPSPSPSMTRPFLPPFVSSEVENRPSDLSQGVPTSLDTNGFGGSAPAPLAGSMLAPDSTAGLVTAAKNVSSTPTTPAVLPLLPTSRGSDEPAIATPVLPTEPQAREPVERRAGSDPASAINNPALQPPVQPLQPKQAGEVSAAALHHLSGDLRPVSPRARDDRTLVPQPVATADPVHHAIAATGEAQQAPLDMGRPHWPQAMIDRIDALRDQADAASTRIRLVPDALGAIDVALRRDGDTVHVHFTADQADTRAILTDAQPRLADLAQARGLRIGEAAVGGGGDSAGRQAAPAWQPPLAARPAPAAATGGDATTDIRIA